MVDGKFKNELFKAKLNQKKLILILNTENSIILN